MMSPAEIRLLESLEPGERDALAFRARRRAIARLERILASRILRRWLDAAEAARTSHTFDPTT